MQSCAVLDTTTTENIFLGLCKCVENLVLHWDKLKSITTDGARNMVESKIGVLPKINEE